MDKPEIILSLKMLRKDQSSKEFYFASSSFKELDMFLFLKDLGLVILDPLKLKNQYNISITDKGLRFIDQEDDSNSTAFMMNDLI